MSSCWAAGRRGSQPRSSCHSTGCLTASSSAATTSDTHGPTCTTASRSTPGSTCRASPACRSPAPPHSSCHAKSSCTTCGATLGPSRSEEHTSELQSRLHLVCRLLLEKKKKNLQEKPNLQHPHADHC